MSVKIALRGLLVAAALAWPTWSHAKTIRAVMHSDLRALDPILSSAYIGTTSRDLFSFLILILILLYKPTGLFGTRTAEER